MPDDIVEELDGLIKQAETENSHFYVGNVCRKAIAEILMLRSRPTYDAYHAVCQAYWKRVEESKDQGNEEAATKTTVPAQGNGAEGS